MNGTPSLLAAAFGALAPALLAIAGPARAADEIKLGQTMPYSGPVSAFGAIGKAEAAYVASVNAKGGVNGRKINLISLDDSFTPPKALQQTRRLVESDGVLAIVSTVGSLNNLAIQKYLVEQKVPQLFVASGGTRWGDHRNFPGSIGWQPSYATQMKGYVDHALAQVKEPRIGILYSNDDAGRDMYASVKAALGADADKIIAAARSYEGTDPTVDSYVIALKASGANVFMNFGTPKFAAQAIRKAYDIDWRPLQFVEAGSVSLTGVLQPAGLDKSVGLVTGAYLKDPTNPEYENDPEVKSYREWMAGFYRDADPGDILNVYGYSVAQTLVHVLEKAGDDLSRENLLKQAASISNLRLPMLVPGLTVNTAPDNYFPIKGQRLQRFDGKRWVPFGSVIIADPK